MTGGGPEPGHTLAGGCLCAAVRYAMAGPFRPVHVCHCSQCRKWSGHAVAATACLTERLAVSGEEALAWCRSSAEVRRGFCRHCGSSPFWRAGDGRATAVMAGTIDPPTGLATGAHIFTGEASDYAAIPDDAPHHERAAPAPWDPSAA